MIRMKYILLLIFVLMSCGCRQPYNLSRFNCIPVDFSEFTADPCNFLNQDIEVRCYFSSAQQSAYASKALYEEHQTTAFPVNSPRWKEHVWIRSDYSTVRNGFEYGYVGEVVICGRPSRANRKTCSNSIRYGGSLEAYSITAVP